VLPGGTLTVVLAGDEDPAVGVQRTLRERVVDAGERELRELPDVRPVHQDVGGRGDDVIRGDVVRHLQEHLTLDLGVERLADRRLADVRPLDEAVVHGLVGLDDVGFRAVVLVGEFEPGSVEVAEFVGEVPRVDDLAFDGRGGGDLGRTEVDGVVLDSGAPLEVAIERPQRDRIGGGDVTDPDTRPAGRLREVDPGRHQLGGPPLAGQKLRRLLRPRRDDHLGPHIDLAVLEHLRGREDVLVAAVGTRADDDLIDRLALDLADGDDVVRHRRRGDERFDLREVDHDLVGVLRVVVGRKVDVFVLATLAGEVVASLLVGREDRGGRAELRAHVRDRGPFGHRERLDARTGVLEDLADAALHREPAEHLEDDVLRGGPLGEFALESDVDYLGHLDVVGTAAHRDGDVEPARADRELAEPAGRRGVRIRAQQRLAGRSEVLLVDVVADPVAGS